MFSLDFEPDQATGRVTIVDNVGGANAMAPVLSTSLGFSHETKKLEFAQNDLVEQQCQWRPHYSVYWQPSYVDRSFVASTEVWIGYPRPYSALQLFNSVSDPRNPWAPTIERDNMPAGSGEGSVQIEAYVPRGASWVPFGSHEEQTVRVATTCTLTVTRQGAVRYKVELYGEGTATLPRINELALLLEPFVVNFGTLPLGGQAVREMKLSVFADLPYVGTIRYLADEPSGTSAKIGGADLRVWASYVGNYVDLSGGLEYPVRGNSGLPMSEYNHKVYIDTVRGGQLGSHRTNLRMVLKHD